jgi:hypothetical protein
LHLLLFIYLAGECANGSAVSVFEHDSAVLFVNNHLSAIFRSIQVIRLTLAPKIVHRSSTMAPLETFRGRAQCIRPVARVVFPFDPCNLYIQQTAVNDHRDTISKLIEALSLTRVVKRYWCHSELAASFYILFPIHLI